MSVASGCQRCNSTLDAQEHKKKRLPGQRSQVFTIVQRFGLVLQVVAGGGRALGGAEDKMKYGRAFQVRASGRR